MTTFATRLAEESRPRDAEAPERPVGHSTGWWGMVLLVATESTMFAAFLASYFYLRFVHGGPWPPPADEVPGLFWPSIGTGILIAGCVPLFLAGRAAARRSGAGVSGLALVVVWLTGLAFVAFQALDWRAEWPASTLTKDAYGSLFYVITGLHVAHVAVGLLMLLMLIARALVGPAGLPGRGQVGIVAIYWYFLVVLAVAIYLVVYLSPYL
jgi:cytochrome c oxidase subunit 3/cytochrome c oxidase subunit I+III